MGPRQRRHPARPAGAYSVTHVVALDRNRALSASADHTLRQWDLASGDTLRVLQGHSAGVGQMVALELMAETCPTAYLVIDETYREAAYADNPVAETALGLGRKVVSVASLSKCHGAPGLRIGWAITRCAALHQQLAVAKFNTIVSCPRVEEALALRLFEHCVPILAERRVLLDAGLQQTAAWVRANADYVEYARVPARSAVFASGTPPLMMTP